MREKQVSMYPPLDSLPQDNKVAVATAPPLAAVALTAENSITVAEKTKALLKFFNVSAIGHGQIGQVHIVFDKQRQAEQFIAKAKLVSERPVPPGVTPKRKGIDVSRYPGQFLVRVGKDQYNAKVAGKFPFPESDAIESSLTDSRYVHKSELSTALYGLMGIDDTFLGYGSAPQVQFVFKTMSQAMKFIQHHDLHREKRGHESEPKTVDEGRHAGRFTVRLNAGGETYRKLQDTYALAEAKELPDAPPPPRGRF